MRATFVTLALVAGALSARGGQSVHDAAPKRFGTTFSHRELEARNLDWRKALDDMDALGFNFLRIGAYWDEIEPTEGKYDFFDLDDLIDRADKKGYELLLSVGMKAPRWPEYHIPAWAAPHLDAWGQLEETLTIPFFNVKLGAEVSKDQDLRRRVLAFVKATVDHVKSLPQAKAIVAWQVENEPMDKAGPDRDWIGADFVAEEARLIRQEDPTRLLVVNCWSEDQRIASFPWTDGDYDVRNALDVGDVLGLDTYKGVGDVPGNQADVQARCVDRPREGMAKALARGKDAWIVESQAEGWGSYQPTPDDVTWIVDQHLANGYKTILLWGFESWYQAKVQSNDTRLWDCAKDLAAKVLR